MSNKESDYTIVIALLLTKTLVLNSPCIWWWSYESLCLPVDQLAQAVALL